MVYIYRRAEMQAGIKPRTNTLREYISVFSPNARKCGSEELRIRTLVRSDT